MYFQYIILYFDTYLHINIYVLCTITAKNTNKMQEPQP
jgi:hypothetical protein